MIPGKELNFCHKLWFSIPYIFATFDIENYKICWIKKSKFEISQLKSVLVTSYQGQMHGNPLKSVRSQ